MLVDSEQLKRRFYPETNIGGFSHVDGTISFFNQLIAIVRPDDLVLDFGAGRGAPLLDDPVGYRRNIGDFRGRCKLVYGCDVDPVVLQNPFIDDAKVVADGATLPYDDNFFDIIVARYVFEHIASPGFTTRELIRVLKPGGVLAAVTPNKFGYIALAAQTVPNRYHVKVLSRSQPDRKPRDVFQTHYRLNTRRDLRKFFGDCDLFVAAKAAEPAYHFGIPWLYRLVKFINKHVPDRFLPVFDIYVRKRSLGADQ